MPRDLERVARVRAALADARLDALICALPPNVRMISGYWPVIGNAIAIATRDGAVAVVAPEDEADAAGGGWADEVRTFRDGSLDALTTTCTAVLEPLRGVIEAVGLRGTAVIGVEGGATFDPAGYASSFVYGAAMPRLVRASLGPAVCIRDADDRLQQLRSTLTTSELAVVRSACATGSFAFEASAPEICAGQRECEVAATLRGRLAAANRGRAGGFAYCMSGPRSACAGAAYQATSGRPIEHGDIVLLHVNSYCDGLWTDITRTFVVGPAGREETLVADTLEAAGEAAVAVARPGVRAADVDLAAREVLRARHLGGAFTHATGHGVGFSAIDHHARPRIHPRSDDVLETGMVFNVEPAAYFPGRFGMRHCDMVVVTEHGAEVLTAFQPGLGELRG